jgi:hypothetical protein
VESIVQDAQLESLVQVGRGTVLFIPAGTSLQLHSLASAKAGGCKLLAYAATANDNMFVSPIEAAKRMYRSMSDLTAAAKAKLASRERELQEEVLEVPIVAHAHSFYY